MAFRPALRPGAPLLRRDATHLQIGTSPGIVIPDRPGLLALLRLLDGVRDIDRLQQLVQEHIPELHGPLPSLLAELLASGAIVDATTRSRPRRSAHSVDFDADHSCRHIVDASCAILSASGLDRHRATEPDLLIISSCGEAARTRFERAVLFGTPHLAVVVDEDRVRIGPLVRPGLSPCVNCHDLHRTTWDRAWPALLHQLGRPAAAVTCAGLEATTAHAAAVEIAVEVLAFVDGQRPRTTGHCLLIGPRHDQRLTRAVPFHPSCTCDLLTAA